MLASLQSNHRKCSTKDSLIGGESSSLRLSCLQSSCMSVREEWRCF